MTHNEPLEEITKALTELSVASWRMVSSGVEISNSYYKITSVADLETTLEEIKRARQALTKAERKIKQTIQKASA
jgi:hypothetical protein